MNKIISKEHFSEKVFKLVIEAPLIAKSRKAGHFVIVRVGEKGERMPLTIAGADPVKGTITLVVQEVGLSSTRLCELNEGDYITDVVGPLGKATHIENFGTVVCAGGGVGVAPMLPIVQALKAAGNRVITVLAGRTKELIILEKEMRESSDEVFERSERKEPEVFAALADFALISPLRGQLLPREKPFCVPKLLPFCYYFFAIA